MLLVVTERRKPVAPFCALIEAPGRASPCWSVAVPVRAPPVPCAYADAAPAAKANASAIRLNLLIT